MCGAGTLNVADDDLLAASNVDASAQSALTGGGAAAGGLSPPLLAAVAAALITTLLCAVVACIVIRRRKRASVPRGPMGIPAMSSHGAPLGPLGPIRARTNPTMVVGSPLDMHANVLATSATCTTTLQHVHHMGGASGLGSEVMANGPLSAPTSPTSKDQQQLGVQPLDAFPAAAPANPFLQPGHYVPPAKMGDDDSEWHTRI